MRFCVSQDTFYGDTDLHAKPCTLRLDATGLSSSTAASPAISRGMPQAEPIVSVGPGADQPVSGIQCGNERSFGKPLWLLMLGKIVSLAHSHPPPPVGNDHCGRRVWCSASESSHAFGFSSALARHPLTAGCWRILDVSSSPLKRLSLMTHNLAAHMAPE
jgi:hypothetical protein